MKENGSDNTDIIIGVVGLGLMGCSICTCLLIAGHKVIAVAPIPDDLNHAEKRIRKHLDNLMKKKWQKWKQANISEI